MFETKTVVICDRCKKVCGEPADPKFPHFTAGFYQGWLKYMDPGEVHVCDVCMWQDPRYIADYGFVPKAVTEAREFRYGDNKTIHGTSLVNVERDHKGEIVSVWFRCMPLPFDQHIVAASRAQEMRTMYKEGRKDRIKAIVFESSPK